MSLVRTGGIEPFVALGYLSGSDNRPRRDKIRQVSRPFAAGGVVYRFVLAMAESAIEHSATTLLEARTIGDMVMLNVSDTPFRCALKYVMWTSWARDAFPTARYLASGDDDAYVQLAHLEADLRLAHAQVGDVPAYYGCIMWRPYYNNVTQDASTGFTGWTCADGQAAGVRRGMESCASQAERKPAVRKLRLKSELAPDAPACAGMASNEKRLNAVLGQQVDWDLPPFPMANGPLFAVSRPLAGLLARDLELDRSLSLAQREPQRSGSGGGSPKPSSSAPMTPRRWVRTMEAETDLGRRYGAYRDRPKGSKMHRPVELQRRACWPNGDNVLALHVAWAAMRHGERVTLINTPPGEQHYAWPVYSDARSYSNKTIVAHGAKRPSSRMWGVAVQRMSGAFVPFHRTCGTCGGGGGAGSGMGWSSYPGSMFASWQCCGRAFGGNSSSGGGKRGKSSRQERRVAAAEAKRTQAAAQRVGASAESSAAASAAARPGKEERKAKRLERKHSSGAASRAGAAAEPRIGADQTATSVPTTTSSDSGGGDGGGGGVARSSSSSSTGSNQEYERCATNMGSCPTLHVLAFATRQSGALLACWMRWWAAMVARQSEPMQLHLRSHSLSASPQAKGNSGGGGGSGLGSLNRYTSVGTSAVSEVVVGGNGRVRSSAEHRLASRAKVFWVEQLLKEAAKGHKRDLWLFTDVDVAPLGSYWDLARSATSSHEIVFMAEPQTSDGGLSTWVANSGFYALRNTARVRRLMQHWAERLMSNARMLDQDVLNWLLLTRLQPGELDWGLFDGGAATANATAVGPQTVAYHAAGVAGVERKAAKLREAFARRGVAGRVAVWCPPAMGEPVGAAERERYLAEPV